MTRKSAAKGGNATALSPPASSSYVWQRARNDRLKTIRLLGVVPTTSRSHERRRATARHVAFAQRLERESKDNAGGASDADGSQRNVTLTYSTMVLWNRVGEVNTDYYVLIYRVRAADKPFCVVAISGSKHQAESLCAKQERQLSFVYTWEHMIGWSSLSVLFLDTRDDYLFEVRSPHAENGLVELSVGRPDGHCKVACLFDVAVPAAAPVDDGQANGEPDTGT